MYVEYGYKGKLSTKFLAFYYVLRTSAESLTNLIQNTLKEFRGFRNANEGSKGHKISVPELTSHSFHP